MKKIPQYKPREVEEEMMKAWREERTFQASLERTEHGQSYSFYDGPPFANGLPHFGHSLVQSIKDAIGRYQTMRGRHVERINGWDCHGLPVEFAIEKQFDISGKKQIMDLGLEKFNQACRDSVFSFKSDWENYFERIGRWTDIDNAYATIDISYTESVWWTFKQIHDKGLIYKGFKCMPYCPRCATPLSNFEVNEGYRDGVSDPSVFAKFKICDEDAYMLAWTTTPWSLPGNAALAISMGAEYVRVRVRDDDKAEDMILAKKRLGVLKSDNYEVLETIPGKDLVGKRYEPIFELDNIPKSDNLYKIWPAEFVSIEDGTGVLHVAPAFGEDDLGLGQQYDIPVINTIGPDGKVKSGYNLKGVEGKFFKSADKLIIEQLTLQGKIYAAETFEHTYPFCYRCDAPLLYYAIDTWFVAVSTIKDQLQRTAKDIHWSPSHIKEGRFGKWLEGARDWAISRNRYWGAPIPIWVNEDDESDYLVIESIKQLKELSGNEQITDLHRPYIDEIVIKQENKTYRRVEEVMDCWFESGSMPIAQHHYPFENKAKFEENFPADYIGEGLDQTRLWFYVLHVISTIVFDSPAYKNVLVNGMVMAPDGQKLSKRLKNYPPIEDVFEHEGADALRYYLLSSAPAVSADYMNFDRNALKDVSRNLFMTLYNSASFLSMYAQIDHWRPAGLDRPVVNNLLDRWLIERVNQAIVESTRGADSYELSKASRPVLALVDDLSNWYVRRSRRRFWKSDDDSDKKDAYATLYWALISTCQLLAPWAPFISDWLYRHLSTDLKTAPASVHLMDWPEATRVDTEILDFMTQIRTVINEGLAKRADSGIKVRQPLSKIIVSSDIQFDNESQQIISEELNIKHVELRRGDGLSVELDTNITQTLKNEGIARDIIRNIQSARKQADLQIENRIRLGLTTDSKELQSAIDEYQGLITEETLASEFSTGTLGLRFGIDAKVEGHILRIELEKI